MARSPPIRASRRNTRSSDGTAIHGPSGLEILDEARDEPVRAFGYGYLAHLAADAVAHNYFVPHQLAVTSSTSALGHSYWESRFETHIGDTFPRRAHEIILLDHARSDEHLDRILSPTIFQHADQPADLSRDGVRHRHGELAADLHADGGEQPLGSRGARSGALPHAVVRLHHGLSRPRRVGRNHTHSILRATARCAPRSSCAARRCGAAATTRCAPKRNASSACRRATLAFTRALAGPLYVPALAPRS